jgi:hypothetical protein
MYFIGPLLFWACAEMTCGFFILCVPCLPKVIKESGLRAYASRVFGRSWGSSATAVSTPKQGTLVTWGGSGAPKGSLPRGDDKYVKMEDGEEVPLEDLEQDRGNGETESQESLTKRVRDADGQMNVTRTTDVVVSREELSPSRAGKELRKQVTPWADRGQNTSWLEGGSHGGAS